MRMAPKCTQSMSKCMRVIDFSWARLSWRASTGSAAARGSAARSIRSCATRAALDAGAAELGVATVAEAVHLRQAGITAPVLAWLHPPGTDFAPALQAGIQIAVSSPRQLADLLDAVSRTGCQATVTVKTDTGLNRNGVGESDYPAVLDGLDETAEIDMVKWHGSRRCAE